MCKGWRTVPDRWNLAPHVPSTLGRRTATPGGMIDIAVLASGTGTNLAALLESPEVRDHIRVVVSDRAGVGALDLAGRAGIPARIVPFGGFPDRRSFSLAVADAIEEAGAKGVVLAGFMRILAPEFVERFPGRILNIHPSLLPLFPGARAVEAALEAGVDVTGVTVHFVDEEVDHGPIVRQVDVPVLPGDDPETLHRRIKTVEHRIYPEVVAAFVSGRLRLEGDRVVMEA